MKNEEWFLEKSYYDQVIQGYQYSEKLYSKKSNYQMIEVFQTKALGKLLTLNGKTMVSELDEFVYHESLTHVPMIVHPQIKTVCIIGGGDGGLVRELVKYSQISKIDLVEIDRDVIEVSQKFFPSVASGLSDSRVEILAQDGIEFLKNYSGPKYDLIIIDSTDPEDFATGLFTKEFYSDVHSCLSNQGIMVNQLENPFFDQFEIKTFIKALQSIFLNVEAYTAPIPIYPGVSWTFGFASKGLKGTEIIREQEQTFSPIYEELRWYNPNWHKGSFALSNLWKSKLHL